MMKRNWLKPVAFALAVCAGWAHAGGMPTQGGSSSIATDAGMLTPDTVIRTVPMAPGDEPPVLSGASKH